MRVRHRIPSIFNLSMVDVLCCALGCVILLWLLNMRDARQHAVAAGESDHVGDARERAAATRSQLAAAEKRERDTAARLRQTRSELDAAEARTADTKKLL